MEEDIAFINALNLPVNSTRKQENTKPRILLGCDQMWHLLRKDESHIELPSGLHLLPTHLGHLLTGRLQERPMTQKKDVLENKEILVENEWKKPWSIEARANIVSSENFSDDIDESTLWERYWSLEQDGIEEYARPEKEVQALVDQQVMDRFWKTIEKKDDGYYVRLPWKEIPVALPDNRAIALRRLMSVWTSLKKDHELLEKYNNIFQEQLRLNIIEEINDEQKPVNGIVHYLPHQAVLTPQKNTTKIRIVFDASAHYKDSPSLNDALHRGPVILPKLYGMLLRFRIGRVTLIADVEKAFLQVRLQHVDRDATRCLWLRDHTAPPSKSNIRVFRFTRLTIGLLSSPFLLAATTHYHLDQYKNDTNIVKEIKENLYVDNLLLTMNTKQEAIQAYSKSKSIFRDSKMNLREFNSNESEAKEKVEENVRSTESNPKVLGIKWLTSEDKLFVTCRINESSKVIKRTVASSVASVYDPMGWMLPLVHRAKVFLQSLWINDYKWDEPLPEEQQTIYKHLIGDMQGFQKELPRFQGKTPSSENENSCSEDGTKRVRFGLASHKSSDIPDRGNNSHRINSYLTDSEIALHWIKKESSPDWGPYIKKQED